MVITRLTMSLVLHQSETRALCRDQRLLQEMGGPEYLGKI